MDGLDSDSDKSVESDEDSVLAAFEGSGEREKRTVAVDGGKDIESDNTSKQDIFVKILQELSSLNEKVDSLLTKDGDTSLELDNLISRVETLEKGIVDKDGLVSRTDAALVFRFVCFAFYFIVDFWFYFMLQRSNAAGIVLYSLFFDYSLDDVEEDQTASAKRIVTEASQRTRLITTTSKLCAQVALEFMLFSQELLSLKLEYFIFQR